nr:hypothetical protein [Euzebya rosea]
MLDLTDVAAPPVAPTPGRVVVPTLGDVQERAAEVLAIADRYDARDVRVFGSVAADSAVAGSNLNLLVDIPPTRRLLVARHFAKRAPRAV